MQTRLLAAMAAALALAAAGCGSDSESEPEAAADGGGQATGSGVDRAFVAEMTPHHESAVEMAEIAQDRGKSTFVKQLADDIVRTQNAEISTMRVQDKQLAAADVKPSSLGVPEHMMGMDQDIAMLKNADPFDREFLRMMIPHHEGAVTMARAELEKARIPSSKSLPGRSRTPSNARFARCAQSLTRRPMDEDGLLASG